MKSLEELMAIKAKMQDKIAVRTSAGDIRIVVGMATCGIAAGARPVLNAFVEAVNAENLEGKVTVTQTGCIGICQYEPVVEVFENGKEKVTYVKMTPDKAKEVIEKHIIGGSVISEYTVSTTDIAK
jgi:NADP-reducing hydrogenase subunit HndB